MLEIAALTIVGAMLGCGSGSGSGAPGSGGGIMPAPQTCGAVDPCGGDPTGTWKVLGGCITPAETADANCLQETFELTTLSYTGTVTFNQDMTYTATNFTEDRAEVDTFPGVCLAPYSDETCADKNAAYQAQVKSGGLSSAMCSGSTTCTCSLAGTQPVVGGAGTYSILGNVISFTPGSSAGSFSYCVQSGLLHLMVATTAIDSSGTASTTVYEDIVAQLQ